MTVIISQAVAMKLVMEPSRSLFFIFEQPSQSWGFKQTYILELKHIASMQPACVGGARARREGKRARPALVMHFDYL